MANRTGGRGDDGVAVRWAGRVPPTRGWSMPRHAHAGAHELIVVVTGQL